MHAVEFCILQETGYSLCDEVLALDHHPVPDAVDNFDLDLRYQHFAQPQCLLVARRILLSDYEQYRQIRSGYREQRAAYITIPGQHERRTSRDTEG